MHQGDLFGVGSESGGTSETRRERKRDAVPDWQRDFPEARCRHHAAFLKYHRDNPEVWRLFKRFAKQAIETGRDTFSISMITERVRWYTVVETRGDDGFKISNNHRAYYARLYHETYPEYDGFFRTRPQTCCGKGKKNRDLGNRKKPVK